MEFAVWNEAAVLYLSASIHTWAKLDILYQEMDRLKACLMPTLSVFTSYGYSLDKHRVHFYGTANRGSTRTTQP